MTTNVDEIKIMLALYGAPLNQLNFTRPCDLAESLRQVIKYENIPESCLNYILKKRLLAHPGYNKYEVSPKGAWK
jgi:hypothetical protein